MGKHLLTFCRGMREALAQAKEKFPGKVIRAHEKFTARFQRQLGLIGFVSDGGVDTWVLL